MSATGEIFDLRGLLAAVEEAPPVAVVDALEALLATRLGALEVGILIADLAGGSVVRLSGHTERADPIALSSSPYGSVIRTQQPSVEALQDRHRVLAPVTNRGSVVGVLELHLAEAPDVPALEYVAAAAHALGYVIIANARFTDLFEWSQRTAPFTLAGEIQRRLLPATLTCEGGQFTLAGSLEPSSSVGGDTLDYSVDRTSLYLSITDAMGHEVEAALLATLLVGSLRNTRRKGQPLDEQAAEANAALVATGGGEQFVTGQIARVDLATGRLGIVNAGHPLPLLVRDGICRRARLEVDLAFGMMDGTDYRVQHLELEPGDRLVFLTDGYLERGAVELHVPRMLLSTRELHPREAVLRLSRALLDLRGTLEDDATIMCLDWYGPGSNERAASGGATQSRASAPLVDLPD